jgi:hypothetical protein
MDEGASLDGVVVSLFVSFVGMPHLTMASENWLKLFRRTHHFTCRGRR